jgi:FkbM family methyltransferase
MKVSLLWNPSLNLLNDYPGTCRRIASRTSEIRNLCVGSRTEPTRLYMNRDKPNSFGLIPEGTPEAIPVLCASLDVLCLWEGIKRLDYLKIDAEGAESMILKGGLISIARFRPIIQVEIMIESPLAPEGYRRFAAQGTPNNLLVPAENTNAIATAEHLGWSSLT